jgi:hypothetical protein
MAQQSSKGGGLSLQTLVISACAAVAAAVIVPLFWEQGTLVATAMTPVVLAIVSEALRKPVERATAVAPRVARRTGTGAALRRFDPDAARTRDHAEVGARGRGPERFEPLPEHLRDEAPSVRSDDPYGLRGAGSRRRPRLKLAILTGLAAFAIAGVVLTASELAIFGGSVSGDRGRTTFFGGGKTKQEKSKAREEATPTATPQQQATPEATATPTPTETPTATPTPSATPSPTPAARGATPAPTP